MARITTRIVYVVLWALLVTVSASGSAQPSKEQSPAQPQDIISATPSTDASSSSVPSFESADKDNLDIAQDIRRGQDFLRKRVLGNSILIEKRHVLTVDRRGKLRLKTITEKSIKPNFLLAVEDLKNRKIRLVRITDAGCVTKNIKVKILRENGVGSRFQITYPENMVVLALRTTVHSATNDFKEVVYTPFSPEIDTPQMQQAGLNYLIHQIEKARTDLEKRKVKLPGFDRLSTNIPTDVALALSIIEHIDPTRFRNCPKGTELSLAHEVLTVIGANTVNAYAHSKSLAGATGLFQIIPTTYEFLRNKYPEAKLKKDFIAGCTDHVNAAKASLLLFDSDLSALPMNRLPAVGKSLKTTGAYLAAAYNCGSGRVAKSAKHCGSEWTCQLPEETKIYLEKFDTVWEMGKGSQ